MPPTVLVVDDEEVVRALAIRVLERAGYRVLSASGGHDALALLEAHRGEVAAVLLDLCMPDLHGREVLARIRASDPGLPVVLSSGLDPSEAGEGGDGVSFLQKPYRLGELLEAVRAAIAGEMGGGVVPPEGL